ncbi:hypothetical protein HanXRQr2_Chr10g0427711 [Helianthus annuus]|uniref:Uncharacterized protein n=1 Tax=Helianthus annuus TaxID=4232 RepID=A0A9K3HVZ8_HELAN|nr:hypothetical protein HanXRQr2_Chr10g0427711 [Helianthus annuus]
MCFVKPVCLVQIVRKPFKFLEIHSQHSLEMSFRLSKNCLFLQNLHVSQPRKHL